MKHHRQPPTAPLAPLARLLLLLAMLLSSLGGLAVATPTAAAAESSLIRYSAAGFDPTELTVAPGTTVTWRNDASAPLALRAGLLSRIFLPLLANSGAAAAAAPEAAAIAEAAPSALAFPESLPPGGEFSFTFAEVGYYPFYAFGTSFTGGVQVATSDVDEPLNCADVPPSAGPLESETPGLLYATAADRTLLRWYWPDCTTAEFAVYRSANGGPEQLIATVTPVTDPAAAEALLNGTDPRWPDLAHHFDGRLLNASDLTTEQLYHYLYTNGLAGVHLSNQYYPLALMLGWGYLDTAITPGVNYSYRVEAIAVEEPLTLGGVTLIAGQPTPLPVPTNLRTSTLDIRPRDGDWDAAQRNRRYDGQIYLNWDLPATEPASPAMVIGYDVFRATELGEGGSIAAAEKVVPFESDDPDALVVPGPTSANGEIGDYLFAYAPGDYAEHVFCVAPRDLLSQAISWPADAERCSAPLPVAAEDYRAPAAPENVRAFAPNNSSQVTIRWSHPQPADVHRFSIQRTQDLHCIAADCWTEVGLAGGNSTSFVDTGAPCANDPEEHSGCWYRVVARDFVGNRSVPSAPIFALNRDTTGPIGFDINIEPCQPDERTMCADIDTDAVSIRVNCVLTPGGEELFIAEIGPDQYESLDFAELIRSVYIPPLHLDQVACRLIGSDIYGNLTDIDDSPVISVDVPADSADQLARPIITQITTTFAGGVWGAELSWEMPAHPMLGQFAIERATGNGPAVPIGLVSANTRSFADSGLQLDERYTYTVRALASDAAVNDIASEPRDHRVLSGETRPLAVLSWLANTPQRNATTASVLLEVSTAALGDSALSYYAVFRSLRADRDFIQITPVLQHTGGIIFYVDDHAQQACYYYSVVTFDTRTGEPTGYSQPQQPGPCLEASPTVYTPGPDEPAPLPPAPLCAPATHSEAPNYDFHFGGGLRVAIEGLNERYTGPDRVDGGGWLRLETAGQEVLVPMSFSQLTVDSAGRVCSGNATVDLSVLPGGGLTLQAPGGWSYRLRSLTLQPWSAATNSALATLDLYSGEAFTNFTAVNAAATRIELVGADLTRSLRFDYQQNFASLAGHSCSTPQAAFRLERLPLDVIPTGLVSIDEQRIEIGAACTRYVDRYNPVSPMVPLPNLGIQERRLLNDGYLAAPLTGTDVSLSPTGLDGNFSTAADLEWFTAYPYGVRVSAEGLNLAIVDGRVASGSTGPGEIFASYHQTIAGNQTATLASSFNSLTIGAGGDMHTSLSLGSISWDAFTMPAGGPGAWMLYIGALTTPGRPAAHALGQAESIMWRPSPTPPTPVALPDGTALQGLLEPGFNRRQTGASLRWDNCGEPATFGNVAVDSYLRLGGITQRQIPVHEPNSQLSIHGYHFIPEQFALHFLDNALLETSISGAIDLPFPSDIEVPLVDVWLTEDASDPAAGEAACVGGGRVPEEGQQQTLAYWALETRLSSAEFRQGTPTVLWFLGELRNLPHLRDGAGSAVLPAELAFDPDGNFHDDPRNGPKYDRPDYRFQGFPFLLERLRLSDWSGPGVGEQPAWSQAASALPAPPASAWQTSGFVGMRGVPVAPYFGPITIAPAGNGDDQYNIAVLPWAPNLTGFASQPRVSKEWVKLARINITFDYDQLVHTYDPGAGEGRFVGFKAYRFVPDVELFDAPVILDDLQPYNLENPLQVLQLDTATVIAPGTTGVHLGLSSGVAALRALAPNSQPLIPEPATLEAWATRMGIADPVARQVYRNQLANAWSQGAFAYGGTTERLDDLGLDQLIDQDYVGGRTQGILAARGVLIRRLRGVIEMEGEGLEAQFQRFRLSTQVEIKGRNQDPADFVPIPPNPIAQPDPPMFYAEQMTLSIERHGDFMLIGEDVRSSQFGEELDSFDATLVINVTKPQFEGGLTLYGLKAGGVEIDNGSAVLGVGADLNYLGLSFDGRLGLGADADIPGTDAIGTEIDIGGDLLAGWINTESEVLQNNFTEALDQIATDLGDDDLTSMEGFYLRAYAGQIPIIGNGCLLNLKGDAEVAFWYWRLADDDINTGGLLRPAVYGEVLCTVQARGALSLQYQYTAGQDRFTGEGYIAGGIGSCEPGNWGLWGQRWWDDSACLQAGAGLNVTYASGEGWDVDYGFDYERLFGD